MPVASCSVFIFLKNIARACPLHKLSPHDNCSSFDRLSEELAVEADSAPINWKLSPIECAASSADLHSTVALDKITSFLFWLNFVTNKNRSERRYDCLECGEHARNGPPAASGE